MMVTVCDMKVGNEITWLCRSTNTVMHGDVVLHNSFLNKHVFRQAPFKLFEKW